MPPGIFGYIWRTSGAHQVGLSILSVAGFLLAIAPLEMQRRIVNGALGKQEIDAVLWLCLGYAALGLAAGGLKLGLNIYRGWVGEATVRRVGLNALGRRGAVLAAGSVPPAPPSIPPARPGDGA
jgi:hypothetical protein